MIKRKTKYIFLGVAFLLGLVIRAIQYFCAPAMWKDELFSVVNIEHMSMMQLIREQPEWNQIAGIGFYLIQKTVLLISGVEHEMVYRFYPFIASVLAMWLFYLIARMFLTGTFLVASVFLFTCSLSPWLYSFSAKPYSGDLLIVMTFVWFMLLLQDRALRKWQYWLAGGIGFVGAIASLPATVLAFGAVAFLSWKRHVSISINALLPCFLLWIAGSAWNIYYTNVIIQNDVTEAMMEFHKNKFPSTSGLFDYLSFYPRQLTASLGEFISITEPFSAFNLMRSIILFILAALALIFTLRGNYRKLLPLLLPLLMALALTTAHLYPFVIRTSLYAIWPLLILPFIGLQQLATSFRWVKMLLAECFAVLLVVPSILTVIAMSFFVLPFAVEPVKKALSHYLENKEQDDVLAVLESGDLYMEYYGPKMRVENYMLAGSDEQTVEGFEAKLDLVKGRQRVWYFFVGHRPEMQPNLSVNEVKGILLKHGKLIEERKMFGGYDTFINLYDFSISDEPQDRSHE